MKKSILLICLCVLLCGCEAKYTLDINDDLSVKETIVGLETEEYYNKYEKSSKDRIIDFTIANKKDYLKKYNYYKTNIQEDNYIGASEVAVFDSLEEYINNSEAYKQFYNTISYSFENNIVKIELNDKLPRNKDSIERFNIDNCKVSIKLPFLVKSHNADKVDRRTNTYIWYIKADEEKNIKLLFDTTKKYKDISLYFSIGCIASVIVILLLIIYFGYKRNRKNNSI